MTRVYLRGFAQRADDDSTDGDGPIPFVLATEGRKADGLNLAMDTLDLARFGGNPVLMYGHEYWGRDGMPIGRVDNARADGGKLLGDLVFDRDDDFAVTVERKMRNKFLNAVSVGFDARDIDDAGVPGSWELFEVSVVPLPMDPDAVADDGRALALARALGAARAGKVLSAKNMSLVEDAIAALTALAAAAAAAADAGEDETEDSDEDAPRAGNALASRRCRLRLAAHT